MTGERRGKRIVSTPTHSSVERASKQVSTKSVSMGGKRGMRWMLLIGSKWRGGGGAEGESGCGAVVSVLRHLLATLHNAAARSGGDGTNNNNNTTNVAHYI